LVVPYHHAKKGDGGDILGLFARKERRSLGSRSGRQQFLLRSGLIQHGMEEMKPLIGIRLGQPKELALHLLDGILFEVGQNKKQLISHRRSRRGVIRTIAPARAGVSINGMLLHIGQKRVFEMPQEGREFWLG
jgi:hypothetical protein